MPSYEQPTPKLTPELEKHWERRVQDLEVALALANRVLGRTVHLETTQQESTPHIPSNMERHAQVFAHYGVTAESKAAADEQINTQLDPLVAFSRTKEDNTANID